MAENLKRRPKKSILKNSSSFDKQEQQHNAKKQKETKWDEMNIIATLHPADKDYGHMKIQEPKTPFNYVEPDDPMEELDASELAERIRIASEQPPKSPLLEESDDDSDEELTEDQIKKKKEFELKRKKHYNEFHALQLAKKLLEEDEDDDDEKAEDDDVEDDYENDEKDPQEQSTSSKAVSPSNCPNKKM